MTELSASFILISVVLSTIVACTLVGNLFVIAAILIDKNLQTSANQLVLSLAVADLMVACLVMPLGAYNDMNQGWYLGKGICEFWTSADVLCCTASILNLLAIAVDRYWAVTSVDYIYKRTRRRVNSMILCVWTVGAIVSLAPIFGWKDPDFARRVLLEHKCLVSQDVGYQIFATISTFYAPLVSLLALYWRIFQIARKRIRRRPGQREPEGVAAVARAVPSPAGGAAGSGKWLARCLGGRATAADVEGGGRAVRPPGRARLLLRALASGRLAQVGDWQVFGSWAGAKSNDCDTLERERGRRFAGSPTGAALGGDARPSAARDPPRLPITSGADDIARASRRQLNHRRESRAGRHTGADSPARGRQSMGVDKMNKTARNNDHYRSEEEKDEDEHDDRRDVAGAAQDARTDAEQPARLMANGGELVALGSPQEFDERDVKLCAAEVSRRRAESCANLCCCGAVATDESSSLAGRPNCREVSPELAGRADEANLSLSDWCCCCCADLCLSCTRAEDSNSRRLAELEPPRPTRRELAVAEAQSGKFKVQINHGIDIGAKRLARGPESMRQASVERAPPDKKAARRRPDHWHSSARPRSPSSEWPPSGSSSPPSHLSAPSSSSPSLSAAFPPPMRARDEGVAGSPRPDARRSALIRRKFRALGQLVSFVQTSRRFNSSSSLRTDTPSAADEEAEQEQEPEPSRARKQVAVGELVAQFRANKPANAAAAAAAAAASAQPATRRRETMDIKREKKAAKTLAIITGVFVCCWLPFFLNAIVMPICGPSCTPSDLILSVLLWLGYLNSLLNPIIYTIFSPDFRRAFRRLLCWRLDDGAKL